MTCPAQPDPVSPPTKPNGLGTWPFLRILDTLAEERQRLCHKTKDACNQEVAGILLAKH
jgi:hypothetical protein